MGDYKKIKTLFKNCNIDQKRISGGFRIYNVKKLNEINFYKIVSSSLHGLIVSDAYKIPNVWIQFYNNIRGDNTKFYDYFKSVNRKDTSFINSFTAVRNSNA